MPTEKSRSAVARGRSLLAALGVLFGALAAWALLDASRFSVHAALFCGALCALFLGVARWASARWVERMLSLLTTWP